jgi:hypothetical protein
MRCEDVVGVLRSARSDHAVEMQHAAAQHAACCESCRSALRAVEVLRAERKRAVPMAPGALERMLARSTRMPTAPARRAGFWLGAAVGAAAAAGLAILVITALSDRWPSPAASVPEVLVTLNEARDVSITLDSPTALANARISVTLNGPIELSGFTGERQLEWSTDLASGVNQLTLPIVAIGAGSGQLAVQVQHGDKRRVFVVDVRTRRGEQGSAGA